MLTVPNPAPVVDVTTFKRAAAKWATGCAVITTQEVAGTPTGITMSAVTSLSLDPMQFLICLDRSSRTLGVIEQANGFAINFLAVGQEAIALRFASRRDDKFEGIAWRPARFGIPVIENCLANIVCSVARTVDGGDHVIVIGDVLEVEAAGGDPLLHFQGGFGQFRQAANH